MDTLRDRLAELADEAPTSGAPAAELWVRGKRAHRLRATALASMVLVVVAVGARLDVGPPDGEPTVLLAPGDTGGIALPIEYPVGEELPELGDTPGLLAAIWVDRVGGGAPALVGLVAETGKFGTLPIDLPDHPDDPENPVPFPWVSFALSPDGRRIAYERYPAGDLVVRDLVSGEEYVAAFEFGHRGVGRWVDATHLVGYVAVGSDADAWLWEPGTAPKLVNPYLVPYGGTDLSLAIQGGGPGEACSSPTLQNLQTHARYPDDDWAGAFGVPMLCDVLGITGSEIMLGHWNSEHLPGDWNDPNDGNGTVVALDIRGAVPDCPPRQRCKLSLDDRARRRVVATAGAPGRVSFATDLIAEALEADSGAP